MEVMILLLDTMAMGLVCLWLIQAEQTRPQKKLKGALARVLVLFSFRTGPDAKELATLEKRRRQAQVYRRPVEPAPTSRRRD